MRCAAGLWRGEAGTGWDTMGWGGTGWDACALLAMQVPGGGAWHCPSSLGIPLPASGPPAPAPVSSGPWWHSQDPSPAIGKPRHLTAALLGSPWCGRSLHHGAEPWHLGTAGIACTLPRRQHKLEENLLFSGKFTDALQALMDWLYRAEPQLSEDVPVGGDRDLVGDLMDKHKVGVPSPALAPGEPWAPHQPCPPSVPGQNTSQVQDGASPTGAAPALPKPALPVLGAVLGRPV